MVVELRGILIPLVTFATELLWTNPFAGFFIEGPLDQHQENTKIKLNLEN